ncbi:MAG: uracil-DNA glycosylase [Alphaproteobacteria bacterium]|nr:uracil-DNA glycosylase [Alphaproteobacteria bacterium]
MQDRAALSRLLEWQMTMGADEAILDTPRDRLQPKPRAAPMPRPVASPIVTPTAPPVTAPQSAVLASARVRADAARDLVELRATVEAFDGCSLRRTATHTVFADGNAGAPLMLIGEAPGADEDRIGLPFVGRSGQLLDRMLAGIGIRRAENAYITNVLFWRPPGNRKPTPDETAICLPFVWRHIALMRPKVVVLCGGTATAALLNRTDGITRLRGRWFELPVPGLDRPVPTMATYHPSFLLRAPAHKSEAWRDLLSIQSKLISLK